MTHDHKPFGSLAGTPVWDVTGCAACAEDVDDGGAMTILDPDGVPLPLTEGEIARAFNKALAALAAADALADAVEVADLTQWGTPNMKRWDAMKTALDAYCKARGDA